MDKIQTILTAMRADMIPAQERGRWSVSKGEITIERAESFKRLALAKKCPAVDAGHYTWLHCLTLATMHRPPGETVMNDFGHELRKHLEFILLARGRVLVTGLGLGCVVRGLLAHGMVEHIDLVERSEDVIAMCAASVADPRVTLHHRDALAGAMEGEWDFAWHDLFNEPERGDKALQVMHAQLISMYFDQVPRQGAWAMPRRHFKGLLKSGRDVWRAKNRPRKREGTLESHR